MLARVLARFLARVLAPARILALMLVYLEEMTSKCDTNSKDEIDFLTVKVWNPPRCNLRILDLTNNKNLQRLARLKVNKNQGSVKNKIAETLTQ